MNKLDENNDRALRAAAIAFSCAAGFGTAVALRADVPGEPLGVGIPLSVPAGLLIGWGAGVAAPWPLPAAALVAAAKAEGRDAGKGPAVFCIAVGIACIAGTLVEPVTHRRRPWTRAIRAAIFLNIGTSAALAAAGIRHLSRHGDA